MAYMAGARRLPGESCPPSPRRRPSHRLTHAADASRHRANYVQREVGHIVDHETDFALIYQGEFAGPLDARGGASWRAVDHRHESDRFVWSADLDHLVADHHLDHAGLHDVHAGAQIALVEDDASGAERTVRAGPLGKHSHGAFLGVDVRLAHSNPHTSR